MLPGSLFLGLHEEAKLPLLFKAKLCDRPLALLNHQLHLDITLLHGVDIL